MKSLFFAAAASVLAAPAALAGPYVNAETNVGYTGNDYNGSVTDLHIGYEGSLTDSADFYAQIGPAFEAVDGTDGTNTEFSGKVGVNVAATENFGVYGELAGITDEASNGDDEIDWSAKIGGKFTF